MKDVAVGLGVTAAQSFVQLRKRRVEYAKDYPGPERASLLTVPVPLFSGSEAPIEDYIAREFQGALSEDPLEMLNGGPKRAAFRTG